MLPNVNVLNKTVLVKSLNVLTSTSYSLFGLLYSFELEVLLESFQYYVNRED